MNVRNTERPISWMKGARKAFEAFPIAVQVEVSHALSIVAEGRKPDNAKPLVGLGTGVMELAIRYRGDAWRAVYALRIADAVWVIHAFQKKSTSGIATPRHEIDLIRERIKRLKEELDGRR
ncbi:MAG TPA: type II toxin-antitoxin system RelE/ParE family toxin [Devosia sp.]|jgi:phage-related protein|nr:type II toxin-antitoxin system RelE/ParE family toxin [Devosia sp.]